MTAATLLNRCVYRPEAEEMPQKSIRLSIMVAGIVLVGAMGFSVLLVGMKQSADAQNNYFINITGFITVFAGILIGHIMNAGKMFGLGEELTRKVSTAVEEVNQNISKNRHGIIEPLNATVLGLRNIEEKANEIDKKADAAAENAKVVKDKLEAAPAMPTTMGEWEAAMERVAESAAEKVCGRYFDAQKGTGI